jgi:hypothetical protein
MAERQGFEPWVTQKSHNGFRDRPDQPLWHLSRLRRGLYTQQLDRSTDELVIGELVIGQLVSWSIGLLVDDDPVAAIRN